MRNIGEICENFTGKTKKKKEFFEGISKEYDDEIDLQKAKAATEEQGKRDFADGMAREYDEEVGQQEAEKVTQKNKSENDWWAEIKRKEDEHLPEAKRKKKFEENEVERKEKIRALTSEEYYNELEEIENNITLWFLNLRGLKNNEQDDRDLAMKLIHSIKEGNQERQATIIKQIDDKQARQKNGGSEYSLYEQARNSLGKTVDKFAEKYNLQMPKGHFLLEHFDSGDVIPEITRATEAKLWELTNRIEMTKRSVAIPSTSEPYGK